MTITLETDDLKLFQDLAYQHAGLRIGDQKQGLVQNRLRGRLQACACRSFREYHDLVIRPDQAEERQRCIEALTTNETFFFRHAAHWDFLVERFLPEWTAAGHTRRLHVWCAAASNGCEPYSLAMLLATALRGADRFQVEASDLNRDVIRRAMVGDYGAYDLQKVTPAALARWFVPAGPGRHRVVDELRAMVRFRIHNLMEPSDGHPVDLVFLRNVLIYFDDASKRQVLNGIERRLRPGGLLLLGGSETMPLTITGYRTVGPAIYRREA